MNQQLKNPVKLMASFIVMICFVFQTKAQTLVVPPNPGNLSTVEHLQQSNDYTVEVKKSTDATYTTCFVYKSDNYASNLSGGERRPQTSASFTNVSFKDCAVDVRITTSFTANSVKVRPLNYNIAPNQAGNVITFRLYSPRKISVEVNDHLKPLFLFFDTPDVPNTSATYYYGPGVHNVGLKKVINSNESVYIAGGAVVEGTFKMAEAATNIDFRGRGIISNGALPTLEEQGGTSNETLYQNATFSSPTLYSSSCNNVRFEGFMVVNGAGWTFALPNYNHTSHHNSWRNIKEVQWTGCTDGIWFDGDNNSIDDCFIFTNDDLVTTHGSNNATITNTTMWGGSWGGHLFYHDDYASSSGITFDNINFLGSDGCKEVIWVMSRSGSATFVDNVTFRNVRIEEHLKRNSYMTAKLIFLELKNNKVRNWLFENFTVDDQNADEGSMNATSTGGIVDGIKFRNLRMAGNCISSLSQAHITINSLTTNVTFEGTANMNIKQGASTIPKGTGSYNFGTVSGGSSATATFTIENKGCGALNLTNNPKVTVTGAGFSLVTAPGSPVAAGLTTTFQVKFQPEAAGLVNGTISIANNDANANPYQFNISGTGATSNIVQSVYTDALASDWNDWSWASTRNFNNTSPVKIGTKSVKVSHTGTYAGFSLRKGTALSATTLTEVRFWVYCTTAQTLSFVSQSLDNSGESTAVTFTTNANAWKEIVITRAQLGNPTSIKRINFKTTTYIGDVFYDEIRLVTAGPATARMASSAEVQNEVLATATNQEIIIYPNPALDQVTVTFQAENERVASVDLMTSMSQSVTRKAQKTIIGSNTIAIDVSRLEAGLYLLHLKNGSQNAVKKIIIAK